MLLAQRDVVNDNSKYVWVILVVIQRLIPEIEPFMQISWQMSLSSHKVHLIDGSIILLPKYNYPRLLLWKRSKYDLCPCTPLSVANVSSHLKENYACPSQATRRSVPPVAAWIPENLLAQSPSAGSAARLHRQLVPNLLAAHSPERVAAKQAGCLLKLFRRSKGPRELTRSSHSWY